MTSLRLQQTICVPLDHDRDVLVISDGAHRDERDGGHHVRIKVIEGDKVAETEISLSKLLDLIQEHIR